MYKLQCLPKKQSGFVIVMLVIVLVILLGIAALALDLGRLYVLRSEMQNAVDAAALAAAAELNGEEDAMERAEEAAKTLLHHDSHFATAKDLLGADFDIAVTFYCKIGGIQDGNAECPTGEPDADDPNKIVIANLDDDEQVHYVKVTLNPDLDEDSERYGIDLYFLPALSVIGIDTSNHAITITTALAGRHFYFCNYPPVMLCDPFEGSGGFRNNVDVGDEILLKLQGGPNADWAPGMFGFLDPPEGDPPVFDEGGGVKEVAPFLGNEGKLGCTPPMVMPETGQMATPMTAAMNTRFDEYGHPPFNGANAYKEYPPATNINDYGGYYDPEKTNECPPANYCDNPDNITEPVCWRDSDLRCPGGVTRIGSGDWSREGYWKGRYNMGVPAGLDNATRYDTYMYEINDGVIPYDKPELGHQDVASPERRVIYVAVLSCNSLNVQPNEIYPIIEPDNGFAKLFITERSAGSPANNFFVEFMGWAQEKDANYRIVVQLYE